MDILNFVCSPVDGLWGHFVNSCRMWGKFFKKKLYRKKIVKWHCQNEGTGALGFISGSATWGFSRTQFSYL